ncbi:BACON domain-containing protein [Porphyromonas somerae]|uniref:BACON domain-containing protein n=1 Tax=Porphyromonas somerae TaxID=322095 RepID=UPI002A82F34E|nr:BACON domain-containing protein [Porphyromonas somerae]MDY3885585.1 BACON domain-containing protein [Porphyromonas somerae]
MKKIIYNSLSLMAIVLMLSALMGACKNDSKSPVFDNRDQSRIQVLASKTHFDTSGGTGAIQLNQEGFSFKIEDATWCKVTPAGDKGIHIEVEPNPLPQSRNTVVIITKGDNSVTVPVIQIGSTDDATLPSELSFESKGGSKGYEAQFDTKPTITLSEGAAAWLSVEYFDGAIVITAKPYYLQPTRTATITIEAGLFKQEVAVSQKGVLPPAKPAKINSVSEVLGDYAFKFKLTSEQVYSVPVKLVKGSKANEVVLKGLAVDLVLTVDLTNSQLIMTSAQKAPSGYYLFYGSGYGGDEDCLQLDFFGEGKAVFQAPAMKRGNAFSFVFTSNSKDNCEVMDGENHTGIFKNPRGLIFVSGTTYTPLFGPNDEPGIFFDFSLDQKI